MSSVPLTLGCVDYIDRTRPIIDGDVETPGIDLTCVALPPWELGARWTEFDVAEVAVLVYMMERYYGDDRFIGIPVFPYRAFLLANIIVNADSGIERPRDLEGRRVGSRSLTLTGTLWLRGMLQDEFDVDQSQIRWFTNGRPRFPLPSELRLEVVPPDPPLSQRLEQGEIDAWLGSSPPECFVQGSAGVRALFPNYRQIEEDYARRTGRFPILHMLVMRRELYERHLWIASDLVQLFDRARQLGAERLLNEWNFACGLPWIHHDLQELPKIFGGDWYRNGFQENRETLATMARYAAEQGFTPGPVDLEGLFAAETLG